MGLKTSKMSKAGEKKPILKQSTLSSRHTVPNLPKRSHSKVANSSAEELTLLSNHIEELTSDLKELRESITTIVDKNDDIMTISDMKTFIKATVEGIMCEINKNIEVTIDIKVQEKTKHLSSEIQLLKDENKTLQAKIQKAQCSSEQMEKTEKVAKLALQTANRNEQYSRKNNFKIMDIKESDMETEASLTSEVCNLFAKQSVTLDRASIMAIHRIPGKVGRPKPVLLKLKNNSEKSKLMRTRSAMKAAKHQLVDDVTKLNTSLITRLYEHSKIESAWFFNGYIYGKTHKDGKRYRFELYDDIDEVITK